MLREFISINRGEILTRTVAMMTARPAPTGDLGELKNGAPLFLNQLVRVLLTSDASTGDIGKSAAVHGGDMLAMGFSVAQVVRGYGDVCQAVTELADEMDEPITVDEFHTFNRCLDDATAEAVTAYTTQRDQFRSEEEVTRSGVLAHELRNRVSAISLAFTVIKQGRVAVNGSVGAVVSRNLRRLAMLIERSLVETRVDSGLDHKQRIGVRDLIEDAQADGTLEASARHVTLNVAPVERELFVAVDPHLLSGAVINLLDNALKFTPKGGEVALRTSSTALRVLIEVEDQCGGLPLGRTEDLFGAFEQRGSDRSGLGLGLFISRKGVEASGGVMRVRDLPGRGCIFTIDLPRHA